MTHLALLICAIGLLACGGAQPESSSPAAENATGGTTDPADPVDGETTERGEATDQADNGGDDERVFELSESDPDAKRGERNASKLKPTRTEAVITFIVVDKAKGPVKGVVISLTSPTGTKYYTEETGEDGSAAVLVPVGQTYNLVYLSLGRRDITAKVPVDDKPSLRIKLTLRYTREDFAAPIEGDAAPTARRFVLNGVQFATGKATLTTDSFVRLDSVVEYMMHKKSARIEISGHTDNVGNKSRNKKLSERRAQACRDYLFSKGIERSRIEAKGYGDEMPIASNNTAEGRQKNRRIEATEL